MKKLNAILKVCAFILLALAVIPACKKIEDPYASYTPEREAGMISDWLAQMVTNKQNIDTTSTGLYYIVEKVGSGVTVQTGDSVTVKYTGMFLDGEVFDASYLHAADSTFTYMHRDPDPNKRLIQGWEEGVDIMNKGEEAAFLIPSAKAYGKTGSGSIPPNTPLLFVIKIVNINRSLLKSDRIYQTK